MIKIKGLWNLMLVCCALCAMLSCNPNSSDLPLAQAQAGQVSFFNLIPNSGEIDFYVNGTRQNINKIAYEDNSGYTSIVSGPQSVLFKTDSQRANIFDPVTLTIPTDSSTLFVTGNAVANLIYARDTAKADYTGIKPKLRFINASSDSPAYDVILNSVSINKQAYKSISPFARVDTGKVILKLNLAGTNITVINSALTLQPNKVYTLFVYGLVAGNGLAGLNLGIIANH